MLKLHTPVITVSDFSPVVIRLCAEVTHSGNNCVLKLHTPVITVSDFSFLQSLSDCVLKLHTPVITVC